MVERLDLDHAVPVIAQEGVAAQFGLAVDHHAATAAHRHMAGPAEGQRRVQLVLDVGQRVQHDPVVPVRHGVALEVGLAIRLRIVAQDLEGDGLAHAAAPP